MGTAKGKVDKSTNPHALETGQGEDRQEQPVEKKTEHEKEAGWGDYFRVFTYARKWDYAPMVAAAVASIGSGVVSQSLM